LRKVPCRRIKGSFATGAETFYVPDRAELSMRPVHVAGIGARR
jgi:hypothetical protein